MDTLESDALDLLTVQRIITNLKPHPRAKFFLRNDIAFNRRIWVLFYAIAKPAKITRAIWDFLALQVCIVSKAFLAE